MKKMIQKFTKKNTSKSKNEAEDIIINLVSRGSNRTQQSKR